jgi:hypothetical protein
MTEKAKAADKTGKSNINLLSHHATTAMLDRMGRHNLPPILWRQQADGSWMESHLLPNGRYGNGTAVNESDVPPDVRNKA